jgi:DNA-binding transcriptional LysR family regulator
VDLHRVAIFVKVVEEGGFTAAAKVLGLPKSSVSRAVSLLEEELGARLLRRTTRSVAPTEAGAAFYERAARGLAEIDEAREAVVDLEAEIRGPVRITTSVDAGVMLSPMIASFIELHPAVQVEVVLTGRVVDLIEEGFDLALRLGPLRDERLVAKRLPAITAAVYGSPAYLERHGTPTRVKELEAHRCVLFRTRGRATWTLVGPDGEETAEVGGAVSVDDFAFAVQMVAAGAGLGLLPTFVAERAPVERVLPEHSTPGAPMHLVHAAGRYLPRRVVALRDHLLAALEPAPKAPLSRARRRG